MDHTQLLATVFDMHRDALAVLNSDSVVVLSNKEMAQTFGIHDKMNLNDLWAQWKFQSSRDSLMKADLRRWLKPSVAQSGEFWVQHLQKWIEVSVKPVDEHAQYSCILNIRDITQTKQKVEQSQYTLTMSFLEQMSSVFDIHVASLDTQALHAVHVQQGLVSTQVDSPVWWQQQDETLFPNLKKQTCPQCLKVEWTGCGLVSVHGEEIDEHHEVHLVGHVHHLKQDIGNHLIFSKVAQQTAKNEGLIQRLNAELERAVAQTETSKQMKIDVLANMSHELRTLNAIIGYAELVKEEIHETGECQHFEPDINRIASSGRMLKVLIDNVLDLAKLEAGRMMINFGVCMTDELITEMNQTISPMLNAGVKLICQSGENVPEFLFTDTVKLKQAILNLLSNATQATQTGQIILRLSTPTFNDVRFDIIDTGKGMSVDEQHKLAQTLSNASTSTTQAKGVGLTLAVNLIHALGGHLEFKSQERIGSRFFFTIPDQHPAIG